MVFAARFRLRACVRVSRLQTERHAERAQWMPPFELPPPLSLLATRDSLLLAYSIFARSSLFILAFWNISSLPSFPCSGPFSFLVPVYRCRYYLHDKRPSIAVNSHRVRRAHRVHAWSWWKMHSRVWGYRNFEGGGDSFGSSPRKSWELCKLLQIYSFAMIIFCERERDNDVFLLNIII